MQWDLRTGKSTPAKLSPPSWGINRYGWMAGSSTGSNPAVEENGQVIALPLPAGTIGGVGSGARTISDDGHVIGGQANLANADSVPLRWLCH
ncbi:hypothetical protein GCM10023322_32870 [Rugosimonospora acidiphila]|uniref:Uncharacterized protein n=1 Tax=Rugosimonospora acidiphila TaxID=556531 RepID=A0ABP9RUJ6_9ACTN